MQICKDINQMWHAGINIMVCGQEMLWLYLLLIQDGFTSVLIPFSSITLSRLQGEFPGDINTFANNFEGPLNHWLHEGPDDHHVWHLS